MKPHSDANSTIEEIFSLYEKFGNEEYGEEVTQLEHMVQAAQLAEKEGYDEEVILAAFLHDIGHLLPAPAHDEKMGEFGAKNHDIMGGDYLRQKGFSEIIAVLVEGHVQAKRFLTYKSSKYFQTLSEASRQTLEYQGGKMSPAEAIAFEQTPYFALIIKMREWDEEAKEVDKPVPALDKYKEMMNRHLSSSQP